MDQHTRHLKNLVSAAKLASVKHTVVIETPGTTVGERNAALEILEQAGLRYTYVMVAGDAFWGKPTWMRENSVPTSPNGIAVQVFDDLPSVPPSLLNSLGGEAVVSREDLCATVVQSLISLPWEASRLLIVTVGTGPPAQTPETDSSKCWVPGYETIEALF